MVIDMDKNVQEQISQLQEQIAALQESAERGGTLFGPIVESVGFDPNAWWIAAIMIMILAYVQNISFSIVSRSRNRDNMRYHVIASVFSNGVWFLTFRELILANMTFTLFVPYVIATVSGSVTGAKVSMWIEKLLGASADAHLKDEKKEESVKQADKPIPIPSVPEAKRSKTRPVTFRSHKK
jgi:hypothetical protein